MHPQHLKMKPLLAVLALAGASTAVLADDGNGFSARFSGFGTIGVAKSNSDEGQLTRSLIAYRGTHKDIDPFIDTRLAVQEVLQFGDRWSVTGQLLGQRVGNSEFRPRVEWLFANYKATDWLDLRAGRGVLPLFLLSDSRNVGYGSVWLRAPQEVYSFHPITGLDGIQALARVPVPGGVLTVQPSYGQTKGSYYLSAFPGEVDITVKYKHMLSLRVDYEMDSWTFHAATTHATLDSEAPALSFSRRDDKERINTFGVSYDNGSLIGMAEWARRRESPNTYENTGWYAMGGYRFGKWTPHVIYGSYTPEDHIVYLAGTKKGHSVTAGVRYDLKSGIALKAQFERRDPVGMFFNHLASPGTFEQGKKINAVAAAVDFTF